MKSMGTPLVLRSLVMATKVHLWASIDYQRQLLNRLPFRHQENHHAAKSGQSHSGCALYFWGCRVSLFLACFAVLEHGWVVTNAPLQWYYRSYIAKCFISVILALSRSKKCNIFINKFNIKIQQHRMHGNIYFKHILHSYLSPKVAVEAIKRMGQLF